MQEFLVGRIIKPQGVKGEVKVACAEADINIFKNIKFVCLENSQNKIKIAKLTIRLGFMYLFLQGYNSRNDVECLRGKNLWTDICDVELADDDYLIEDLVDSVVCDEDGNELAVVLDVENYGASDILVVLENKRELRIPFVDGIVESVEDGKVVVNKQKYDEVKI